MYNSLNFVNEQDFELLIKDLDPELKSKLIGLYSTKCVKVEQELRRIGYLVPENKRNIVNNSYLIPLNNESKTDLERNENTKLNDKFIRLRSLKPKHIIQDMQSSIEFVLNESKFSGIEIHLKGLGIIFIVLAIIRSLVI